MWRRTVFWYLLIIYGHTSSQPIEDGENARQTRQLDFGDCCPCPDADQTGQDDFHQSRDSLRAAAVGTGPRSRDLADLDDCPCRPRSGDSDGAASVFFPTASRPRSFVMRPDERKEHVKPLLHPEVDLASSVLQTIREATDDEYEDALARDAARSMAKAAIEDIYGDAAPEASTRNLVTIIVKPKQAHSNDDITPQESRNYETRCIHAPLESTTTLSNMRIANKPPNLLHDIFGLPRRSKPGLLHRNFLDMDSSVGASNVQERVLRLNSDQDSLMESNSKIGSESSNIKSESDCDNKDTNLKLPSIHDKIRDFISGRSSLDGKIKTSIPSLPILKPINSKLNINGDNGDLSSSPSNVDEQVGKLSYIKANSHLGNIIPKTRPIDLKNLLKLKDVEFIPLKELINNAKNQPKLAFPSRITNEDDGLPSHTDASEVSDLLNLVPRVREDGVSDPEGSPSNVNQQVSDDNCENIARNTNFEPNVVDSEGKVSSSEFFNTTPSLEFIESDVDDRSSDIVKTQSSELTDNNSDCDLGTIPATVTDLPLSTERSVNYEIQEIKRGHSDTGTFEKLRADDLVDRHDDISDLNKDDCLNNNSAADTMSGASNAVNTIVEPDSDKHDFVDESIARQTQDGNNDIKSLDNNAKPKLLDPLSLDKTLHTFKKNIIEKIESLKIPKTNSEKSNLFGKETTKDENQNTDSNNEESVQITSVKPEMGSNESSENVDGSQISMQDLQEMSDYMLEHENKERFRNNIECNVPTQEIAEPKDATEMKSTDPQNLGEEKMTNLQNNDDMNTQSSVNTDNVKDTCGSDLSRQSKAEVDDTNVGASQTVISKIPPRNAVQSIQSSDVERPCDEGILKSPINDLTDVLKIPPIPTLDEIKSRVTSLFDKGERSSEDILPFKADSLLDPAKFLVPIMATDASTRNSQSKRPPGLFLDDLDILQLQPLSIFPKSKLTDDLGLKPIKLQSAFDNKGLGLGTGRSRSKNVNRKTGLSNPLDTIGDLKSRSSSSPHNILKSSLKHDDLLSGRALSDLSQNINSHFQSASRNMHNMLESTFSGAKKATPIQLEPHELLDTISRNHEDVSDKLKALHMDFNDRIDTMRNDLFDKSRMLTSEPRNNIPSIKSLGDHSSLLRTSQPALAARTRNLLESSSRGLDLPKLNGKGSLASSRTNKFKMPTAASVPVPKTVNVPKLKLMSKPSGLVPQRTISLKNHNFELPRTNFDTSRIQGSNTKPFNITPLKKPIKPFRNTNVKVSFSTTPRPRIETGKSKSQQKIDLKVTPENHGIKSDLRQTKLSTPTGLLNKHKLVNSAVDSGKKLSTPLRQPPKLGNLEHDRNLGNLQSWPKVSEGAFLSKVKEAVKARLPPSHLSNTLKQANIQPNVKSTLPRNRDDVTNGIDMTRAASEVVERTDGQVLKENVTYKCKLVCTQE